MFRNKTICNIILLWLAWVLIMIGYQAWATRRLLPERPDYARDWTVGATGPDCQAGKTYLLEPFMNRQAAWDSEFYLSIAVGGYDDPAVTKVDWNGQPVSLSYAFFPFYPAVIWLVSWPLKLLGLNTIATTTLAAVTVSALGALGGMIALYFLARDQLGESGGWRAAFYLVVFPSGFFLAVVYSEGLFIGLAFGALVLMLRRKWAWASLLATCATLTRSVGVALVIPMGLLLLRDLNYKRFKDNFNWQNLLKIISIALPLTAFLAWKFSRLGQTFDILERTYFGRGFLAFQNTWESWKYAWAMIWSSNAQSSAYHLMEMSATLLALIACVFTFRRHPEVTLFGLAVILLSLFSGDIQGMYRYVMAAPAVFLFLSRLGKNEVFDRAWTLVSILILAINAYLFAVNMWAG